MRNTLFILCLFCSLKAMAQTTALVTCSSETNPDRSISIYADCQVYGDYTLKLTFSTLTGYKSYAVNNDVAIVSISHGRKEVLKLMPEPNSAQYGFNYRYQYFAGQSLRKTPSDTGFVYLLPGTPDNVLRISKVSNIQDRLRQNAATEFFGTGFIYSAGDTICAARAGIVYETSDEIKEGEKGQQVFVSNRNRVRIQQKDGTIANYVMRAPIKLLVAPGDNVIPGQPMAIFNKESDRYELMFTLNYLDEKKLIAENTNRPSANPSYYLYLPTHFCVGEEGQVSTLSTINQTFKVIHPKTLIAAEMSKKDRKKLGL